MRRIILIFSTMALVLAACSGDDEGADAPSTTSERAARFCDVYLDYITDSSDANLTAVVDAAPDRAEFGALADTVRQATDTVEVFAAIETLDQRARERCQPEWIGAAQGAGTTAAAAEAFFAALVNGDRIGATNVASANAIARFEPWGVIEPDESVGSPVIAGVEADSFSMILGPATLAQCLVETGVVFSCTLLEDDVDDPVDPPDE